MSIEDFTNESGINNEMISKDSLLSDYKFTEALSFDQEYEGVPGGNVLFGGMQVRKKKYNDDAAGIWLGVDSDGIAKLYIGDATNSVKWSGTALTLVGAITATSGTIGGWIIASGSLSSAASPAERIVLNSTDKKIQLFNGSNSEVTSLFYGTGGTNALLRLAPTNDARRALEFIIAASLGGDAKAITIANASTSISIDITDGGSTALYIGPCDTNGIVIANAPTNGAGIDFTYSGGDYPVIQLNQNGTATNSYGIKITQGTDGVKPGIYIDNDASSHLAYGITVDKVANTSSDASAINLICGNNGTGNGSGINFSSFKSGIFSVAADATDPTGGGGAATGRIPVVIGGVIKYLAYY